MTLALRPFLKAIGSLRGVLGNQPAHKSGVEPPGTAWCRREAEKSTQMPAHSGEPQAAACLVALTPGRELSLASCSQDLTPAQVPWGTGDRAAPHPLLSLDAEARIANPSPEETASAGDLLRAPPVP